LQPRASFGDATQAAASTRRLRSRSIACPTVLPFLPQHCMRSVERAGYRIKEDDHETSSPSGVALLLAVTTSAWADGGPYSPGIGSDKRQARRGRRSSPSFHDAQRLGLLTSADGDFLNLKVTEGAGATIVDQRVVRAGSAQRLRKRQDSGAEQREGGSNMATPQQQEMIAAAGRRAADDTLSDNVKRTPRSGPRASSPSPRERSPAVVRRGRPTCFRRQAFPLAASGCTTTNRS